MQHEYELLPIDEVHPSPLNPRGEISEDSLGDLRASIRQHGVLQAILVRPNADGFAILAGERRWRAARLEALATIPARILDVDDAVAEEIAIIENLQREEMPPMREAESYQRLIASGRTIDELAARLGKEKTYIYRRLSLTRLIPEAQELVSQDILPLNYALKLATIPADRQEAGLSICFQPLFRDPPAREHLEPIATLADWIERNVRLDPRTEDTSILLPTLAEQLAEAEEQQDASVLMVSTLHYHTDETSPRPILAKAWKPAEGDDSCDHAQPAVIVLGEGQGRFLHVCAAKHKCERHWPKPVETTEAETPVERAEANLARVKEEEADRAKREALDRWRNEGRPRALHLFLKQAASLKWSPKLLGYVIDTINEDPDLSDVLGPIEKIPVRRYPQVVAASLALDHSWYPEPLIDFAKALGIPLNLESPDEAPGDAQASESTRSAKRRASQKRKQR
jgi:ParB/RepB/Spo0J family partition protein